MFLAYFLTGLLLVTIIEELVRRSISKSHEAASDYSGTFAVKTSKNNTQIQTTAVAVAEEKDHYIFATSRKKTENICKACSSRVILLSLGER